MDHGDNDRFALEIAAYMRDRFPHVAGQVHDLATTTASLPACVYAIPADLPVAGLGRRATLRSDELSLPSARPKRPR